MEFIQRQNTFLKKDSGMVLLVALIMVLIMSVVGISVVKGTHLQQVMAGNMRDSQVSFQAAEAALRLAEAHANTLLPDSLPSEVGIYSTPIADGNTYSYWATTHDWDNTDSVVLDVDLQIEAESPRYVIERLDVGKIIEDSSVEYNQQFMQTLPVYRITARGVGLTDNTTTILQTIYRVY